MTQPTLPDSADWERHWAIDAGSVTLQPVTHRIGSSAQCDTAQATGNGSANVSPKLAAGVD